MLILKPLAYILGPLLIVVLLSWSGFVALKSACSSDSPLLKINQSLPPSRSYENTKISDTNGKDFALKNNQLAPSASFDLSVTGLNNVEGRYHAQNTEGNGSDWTRRFVCETKLGEFSLAVFTLFLVIFTGLLWSATDRLVRGADENARKQLRAYIGVEPRGVRRLLGQDILLGHYALRNVGGIPAKKISMFAVTDYYLDGTQRSFRIGQLYETTTALIPKAEMTFGTATGVNIASLADDQGEDSASGVAGFIFVYGKVTYTDEFGTDGWTEFCHRYPCAMLEAETRIHRKYARYHEIAGNNAG